METSAENRETQVYINGKFFPQSEAKISVFDRSFIYGDAIFEGIPVWKGAPFKLDEHVERMWRGMAFLKIESPVTREEFKKAVIETIKVNNIVEGHMRPIITRGEGQIADRWDRLTSKANFVIMIARPEDVKFVSSEQRKEGLKAIILSIRRVPPECVPSDMKAANYLNIILASIERAATGADVGIMLDIYGNVAEGIIYNIFIVRHGVLYTPTTKNCLPGITRKTVIEIGKREGFQVIETDLGIFDLCTADEVFITSSGYLCVSVLEVDGRTIGDGKTGPIASTLRQRLEEEMDKSAEEFNKSQK
jgi:branched-chain amino acid aminotransferase